MAAHKEVIAREAFMEIRVMIGGNEKPSKAIIMARHNMKAEEFRFLQIHIPPFKGDVEIWWEDKH